jgi:hypothetical protein
VQLSSANHKSANYRTNFFFRFADLPQVWHFANLRFAEYIIFAICGQNYFLRNYSSATLQIHKYIIFLLTYLSIKCSHSNLRTTLVIGTVLRPSYMAFRSLKYIGSKPMRIWIRNTAFFLANLRTCDLRPKTPRKFADLRFAN